MARIQAQEGFQRLQRLAPAPLLDQARGLSPGLLGLLAHAQGPDFLGDSGRTRLGQMAIELDRHLAVAQASSLPCTTLGRVGFRPGRHLAVAQASSLPCATLGRVGFGPGRHLAVAQASSLLCATLGRVGFEIGRHAQRLAQPQARPNFGRPRHFLHSRQGRRPEPPGRRRRGEHQDPQWARTQPPGRHGPHPDQTPGRDSHPVEILEDAVDDAHPALLSVPRKVTLEFGFMCSPGDRTGTSGRRACRSRPGGHGAA